MDLVRKVQHQYREFSKNQRRIADYIVGNGFEASFDSVVEMAKKIGVSESSLVRFAQQLGFRGYPKFRKALQEECKKRISSAAKLRRAVSDLPSEKLFEALFQKDIDMIEKTCAELSAPDFLKAVEIIAKAKKIFIIGFRSSFSLAYFLYFRLLRLQFDARLILMTGGTSLLEQLALLNRRDLLVAIAFDHLPVETRIAIEYAQKGGVKVLGISHNATSSIARNASLCLLAKTSPGRTQSLTAHMALLNALAIGVANKRRARSLRALENLGEMEERYLVSPSIGDSDSG